MQYAKSSLLDLQFILWPKACYAKDIQKTLIFVSTVAEVLLLVEAIRKWMGLLNYPKESEKWIRPYFSTMSDLDKVIIAEAFNVDGNINTDCIILVATDTYSMGIDNPNIKLVIQWDLPINSNTMIQQMGRARKKTGQLTIFILLTPKYTRVKDKKEV